MDRESAWRPEILRRYHASLPDVFLKLVVAFALLLIVFVVAPRSVMVLVAIALLGLLLINRAFRSGADRTSFWQANVLFSERLDFHNWKLVGGSEAQEIVERFGVRHVRRAFRCSDCDALQLHGVDATGSEFLVQSGEYRAEGIRIGLFFRVAKFMSMKTGDTSTPMDTRDLEMRP